MSDATLFHILGGLEHARGRFGLAERWSRRGLGLLAAILHARGRHVEAARLYRRSLTGLQAVSRAEACPVRPRTALRRAG